MEEFDPFGKDDGTPVILYREIPQMLLDSNDTRYASLWYTNRSGRSLAEVYVRDLNILARFRRCNKTVRLEKDGRLCSVYAFVVTYVEVDFGKENKRSFGSLMDMIEKTAYSRRCFVFVENINSTPGAQRVLRSLIESRQYTHDKEKQQCYKDFTAIVEEEEEEEKTNE